MKDKPDGMTLDIQGRCHVGRVRRRNEDCIGVHTWVSRGEASSSHAASLLLDQAVSLVVSDGIGGHSGGNIASRLVVGELVGRDGRGDWQRDVGAAVLAVERAMAVAVARDPQLGGMGATVAGVFIDGRRLRHYNVGDSRVMLLRDGRLEQLSEDDRLGNSPVLTQAIGGYSEPGSRLRNLHAGEIALAPGDTVLVCSDGLTDCVPSGEIEQLLAAPGPEAADGLLERALEAGGRDNIAIIVARLHD